MRNHARLSMRTRFLYLLSWLCVPATVAPATDSSGLSLPGSPRLFPEYHITADVSMFFFQKNAFFEERRFVESQFSFAFTLFSVMDSISLIGRPRFQFGMGRTPGNVVFDPMDLDWDLTPIVEIRSFPVVLQAGLEHRCFHQIDRDNDTLPTVYWNKPFVGVGSHNMSLPDYRKRLAHSGTPRQRNRLAWSARVGYFLKEFFGIVTPGKLDSENNRIVDWRISARYAFYQWRCWTLHAVGVSSGGLWNRKGDTAVYRQQETGVELSFRPGERGALVFLNYIRDDIPRHEGYPRFSKDGLLEIGISLFK